jgi:dCTP deaminase
MLGADEIAASIELALEGNDEGLMIVPSPSIQAIQERGGSSIDLRLGRWFETIRQTQTSLFNLAKPDPDEDAKLSQAANTDPTENDFDENKRRLDLVLGKRHFIPFESEFILHPGRFVLAATLEWIRLPSNLGGYVTGKSSFGRRGLIIETAPGVHPRFSGCLTLEMTNVGEVPLALRPGMKICQLFLHRTTTSKTHSSSEFDGKRRPGLGKLKPDPILIRLARSAKSRSPDSPGDPELPN